MDINAKRQERAELAAKARALLDTSETEKRKLTGEEEATFDRYMADADAIDDSIAKEERVRAKERRVEGEPGDKPGRGDDRNGPDGGGPEGEREAAFRQYLTGGRASLSPEQARSLNASSDPEGGYLVAPVKWVSDLIKDLDDEVVIRGLATKFQLTEAESLGAPSLDTDLNDADWTTEIATGSQDDSLRFGTRELSPNPIAKRVKISRKLLRLTAGGAETIVRDRLKYKFGVTQEKAFMTGDGNKKPLGLFTASPMGISTGRDVVAADVSDGDPFFSGDRLIDAKYTLKTGYLRDARWLFHRNAVRNIRKIKIIATGEYLWQPGLQGDRPDTILDLPYLMSEFVPNTFTAGNYVGMLGSFKHYWIADALDMEVQRLVELYAETAQVGFIGRAETDGMPVLEEAFVRLSVQA